MKKLLSVLSLSTLLAAGSAHALENTVKPTVTKKRLDRR